jgi:hypothetical protein
MAAYEREFAASYPGRRGRGDREKRRGERRDGGGWGGIAVECGV